MIFLFYFFNIFRISWVLKNSTDFLTLYAFVENHLICSFLLVINYAEDSAKIKALCFSQFRWFSAYGKINNGGKRQKYHKWMAITVKDCAHPHHA